MRKILIPLLLLLFLLCGCSTQEAAESGSDFWYLRSAYQYGNDASMFVCEYKEAGQDLQANLSAYLADPAGPNRKSPFPASTSLIACTAEENVLSVTLSEEFAEASPAQLTCAAICLAKTGAALSGCETLQIFLEDAPDTVYLQLSPEDYALYDDVITDVVTTPENEVSP